MKTGVVEIDTTTCDEQGEGTGFLIAPTLVATVDHVVDGSTSITLKQHGKALATGTVIGEDAGRDLALVRTSRPLPGHVVKLANRSPALGDGVAALGFPLGLPLTVTRGTVSGTGRSIPIDGSTRRGLVQTDAAVNPGNSGGPLLSTTTGDAVGLVDLGTTEANGIGFAVSAATAAPLLSAWRSSPQPAASATCGNGGTGGSAPVGPGPGPTTQPTDTAALGSVNSYWDDINNGDFSGAYAYLVPGTGGGQDEWIRGEEDAGIESASFIGHARDVSGSSATVDVDSLETQDSQNGCQSWSGSYSMVRQDGTWLIERAEITPSPC